MSRIIAGRARGVRLSTPSGDRTRPTTDRVREAFFSALATWNGSGDRPAEQHFDGVSFVDLFAGSGAVGLEAASRGASPVVLVERDQLTSRLMAANAKKAGVAAQVVCSSAEQWLERTTSRVDVIWMDPPYAVDCEAVAAMVRRALEVIVEDGIVVVERSARDPWVDLGVDVAHWSRNYGETELHWCRPSRDDESQSEEN